MFDSIQIWLFITMVLSGISVLTGIYGLVTLNNHYVNGLHNSKYIEYHDYWWCSSLITLVMILTIYGLIQLVI